MWLARGSTTHRSETITVDSGRAGTWVPVPTAHGLNATLVIARLRNLIAGRSGTPDLDLGVVDLVSAALSESAVSGRTRFLLERWPPGSASNCDRPAHLRQGGLGE